VSALPQPTRLARRTLLLVLLAVLGVVLAACGGGNGDDEAVAETTAEVTTVEAGPPPPGTPADAAEDFVAAVEANDFQLSWGLLSRETKTTFQIDFQHWSDVLLPALRKELRTGGKVVFDERFGEERALVVLEGAVKGAPFPVALRAEDGGWRVELFYPEFNPLRPTPGERIRAGKQTLALDIVRRRDQELDVRVWLDGEPLTPTILTKGNFLNTYEAEFRAGPGKHLLVAYATTGEGLSGGAAWEFTAR
jgi:hypothetical protein